MKITLFFVILGTLISINLYANQLDITAACRGHYDQIERASFVGNSTDYILSDNIFTARNIKGSTSDSYCKYLTNEAQLWNQVNPGPTATIKDLIAYRCSLNEVRCADDPLSSLKARYEKSRSQVSANNLQFVPPADDYFEKVLRSGRFYDNAGKVITLPRKLVLSVMNEESQGVIKNLNQEDFALGLFGIKRASRMVTVQNGIVTGLYPSGNDYHKYQNLDKFSLYNPMNNFIKYVQIFQGKYLKFQQTLNGVDRPLNFDKIETAEKIKFVVAALEIGADNLIKGYDRLLAYNQAQNCNPCEVFRKSGNTCQNIVKVCSNPHPNRCGKTLPENFDHIIRMTNFTGQEGNLDYQEHMSCVRDQLFGGDSMGPCNLARVKAKVNKILAGTTCY